MDLSKVISDRHLGGTIFSLRRETWRKEYGETLFDSSKLYENLTGNIQPADSEDLKLLPQEQRSEAVIQVLSSFPFSLGTQNPASSVFTSPDLILWQGETYRVLRVKDWSRAGGYHKAWAVRQIQSEGGDA